MGSKKTLKQRSNLIVAEYIKNIWWILIVSSVLLIAVGVYALTFPGATIEFFAILFGLILLFGGAFGFVRSLINKSGASSIGVVFGVIAFIIGIFILLYPAVFVGILVFIFATILLIKSILTLQLSAGTKSSSKGWLIASGVMGIIASIFLFISPIIGGLAILMILGIYAILLGVLAIVDLISIRKKVNQLIKK